MKLLLIFSVVSDELTLSTSDISKYPSAGMELDEININENEKNGKWWNGKGYI